MGPLTTSQFLWSIDWMPAVTNKFIRQLKSIMKIILQEKQN